jgi:hypothetical protein
MASLLPGECCTTGIEHDGTPNGTIENIENGECPSPRPITLFLSSGKYSYIYLVPTYFAHPASPNGNAILIFSDVFGPIYQNIQLMADDVAAQGCVTVVPDLFKGDPLSPEPFYSGKVGLPKWPTRHDTTNVDPIADVVINHLKNTLKVKKLGYCFSAKVSTFNFYRKDLFSRVRDD